MEVLNFEQLNILDGTLTPSQLHVKDNATFAYFRRYLLQKIISVFKWSLPETWNRDYFLYVLYMSGYIAIVKTPQYGVIPQQCSLMGRNVFYAPKQVIINNPALPQTITRNIDEDAVLMKLSPDGCGVIDLVNYYAGKMALASEAVDMNLINSHLAYVFTVADKTAADSFKKLYDKIASGEPAVIQDKALKTPDGGSAWETFSNALKQNYITSDLLSDMRKIETMFDTEVGIPNANTDKRERLISDEVNANNVETQTRAALWLEQLQDGCRKARNMFDININVEWRVDPNESDNVNNRPLQLRSKSV